MLIDTSKLVDDINAVDNSYDGEEKKPGMELIDEEEGVNNDIKDEEITKTTSKDTCTVSMKNNRFSKITIPRWVTEAKIISKQYRLTQYGEEDTSVDKERLSRKLPSVFGDGGFRMSGGFITLARDSVHKERNIFDPLRILLQKATSDEAILEKSASLEDKDNNIVGRIRRLLGSDQSNVVVLDENDSLEDEDNNIVGRIRRLLGSDLSSEVILEENATLEGEEKNIFGSLRKFFGSNSSNEIILEENASLKGEEKNILGSFREIFGKNLSDEI